jgi:hypothetical protein
VPATGFYEWKKLPGGVHHDRPRSPNVEIGDHSGHRGAGGSNAAMPSEVSFTRACQHVGDGPDGILLVLGQIPEPIPAGIEIALWDAWAKC